MRKNTLIKLLAVLAMCFVIGAALVACSETEEPVETAKSVASVNFNAGKLVIAYDDGTTESVDLPAPASCQHPHELRSVEVEAHTAAANGTYIDVCPDCGWAWIRYEQRHVWVDKVINVQPTCTAEGYTIESYCWICGLLSEKTDIKEPVDHVWSEGVDVIDGNICVNGGNTIYTCTFGCGETKVEPIKAAANEGIDGHHTVDAWDFETFAPTLTVDGAAIGECTVCGETVTYDLAAFLNEDGTYNKEVYGVNETPKTSCSQALVAKFTLLADDTIYYADYEVAPAGSAHMLYSNVEKKLVPVYAAGTVDPVTGEEYAYSILEFDGIEQFSNIPINSCKTALAHYHCEVDYCQADAVDIFAYGDHDWTVIEQDEIKCGVEAFQSVQCPDCLKEDTLSLGIREHNYEYVGLVNESVNAEDCDAFSYIVRCTHDNCSESNTFTLTAEDVVVDRTTTPATCEDFGTYYVTYTVPGTSVILTCNQLISKEEHYLNGQVIKAAVNNAAPVEGEDVVYNWYEGCGVYTFHDDEVTADAPILGYFFCDTKLDGETHKVTVWIQLGVGETIAPVEG